MRLPNSYGGVVKLSGKRRKKYAVRISAGYSEYITVPNKTPYSPFIDKYNMEYRKNKNDYIAEASDKLRGDLEAHGLIYIPYFRRKYKYMEYFAKSADAYSYLARMNAGEAVSDHMPIASEPTFKDVYELYIQFAKTLKNKPSETTLHSYKTGFKMWSDVHGIRFRAITTSQLQACMTKHSNLAKSSVGKMGTILKKMYKYAIGNNLCDKDLSPLLFAEYNKEKKFIHSIYTEKEIKYLWDHSNLESAKITLILIYTGMRCTELLEMTTDCIHLDQRYMTGGIKTEAGRNRVIPIHKKIEPIIRELYDPNSKYLYPNSLGRSYTYQHFRDNKWAKWKKELNQNHYTHDCRHTCATKLEEVGVSDFHRKLILGHSIRDLTNGVYTHVSPETLVADMDKWV